MSRPQELGAIKGPAAAGPDTYHTWVTADFAAEPTLESNRQKIQKQATMLVTPKVKNLKMNNSMTLIH